MAAVNATVRQALRRLEKDAHGCVKAAEIVAIFHQLGISEPDTQLLLAYVGAERVGQGPAVVDLEAFLDWVLDARPPTEAYLRKIRRLEDELARKDAQLAMKEAEVARLRQEKDLAEAVAPAGALAAARKRLAENKARQAGECASEEAVAELPDPDTNPGQFWGSISVRRWTLQESSKYEGIAFGDGLFVCAPRNSQMLLTFDEDTHEVRFVLVPEAHLNNYYGVAYDPLHKVFFCPPCSRDTLLLYSRERGCELKSLGGYGLGSSKKFAGVAFGEGVFVCAPYDLSDLLVYDHATGEMSFVSVGSAVDADMPAKFLGIAYGEGLFVTCPRNANHLVVYRHADRSVVGESITRFTSKDNKFAGIAYGNGVFVLAPFCSEFMLVYRPANGEFECVDVTPVYSGVSNKFAGCVFHQGVFFLGPMDSDKMLLYDSVTKAVRGVDCPSESAREKTKYDGIAVGRKYFGLSPNSAHQILLYRDDYRRRAESELLGVSAQFLLGDFRRQALEIVHPKTERETNFHELKPLVYGRNAYGYGKVCPRDGRKHCSLVDSLSRAHAKRATHFLSWVWSYDLATMLSALEGWLEREGQDAKDVFLWICFCCNNQFRILAPAGTCDSGHQLESARLDAPSCCAVCAEEQAAGADMRVCRECSYYQCAGCGGKGGAGADNLEKVFESRLTGIGSMVALIDNWMSPLYHTRIWTQFEQYTAAKLGIDMQMILPKDEAESLRLEMERNKDKVIEALSRIDAEKAKASVPADEKKVKDLIRSTCGFAELNWWVKHSMVEVCKKEFGATLLRQTTGQMPVDIVADREP